MTVAFDVWADMKPLCELGPVGRELRLAKLDKDIGDTTEHQDRLLALQSDLKQRLEALGPKPPRDRQALQDRLTESIRQVQTGVRAGDGVTPGEGYWFPELAILEGKHGLDGLARVIPHLNAERDALLKYIAQWPDANTTHTFRYTGQPYKTILDGVYVQPGELVELHESRYVSLADRFELVTESEPVATEPEPVATT